MFDFRPTKQKNNFIEEWQQAFPKNKLFLIYTPSPATAKKIYRCYVRLFAKNHLLKRIGLITQEKNSILPYLSAKENILISFDNAQVKHTKLWERFETNLISNRDFFETLGKDLTPLQHFYVQFYRQLLAGKKVIIIDTLLDQLPVTVVRQIMTEFDSIIHDIDTSIIILTANQELIQANPQASLDTPPFVQK
ncbi:hypothetical protein [Loigolactobacillus iwatensis]|uniref:hypothetical protein n=1 Tax=Loigolactobacillus iwatensis TaxID=1267156 RepID=UPI000F7EC7C4|nr:hypothetical protein [Loigolactobacillus iwatensis]